MDVTLQMHGKPMRYVLLDDTLTINERVVDLSTVARVRLATLAEMAMCELTLRDGTTGMVATDTRATHATYGALVRALHANLAARPDVVYVRGAWLLVGVMAGIGVLAIVAATALWQHWISVPPMFAGKAMLIMLAGVIWIVVGPLLVWRSRPRSYDPRAVPNDLVA